jgi:hypothetical protein
LATIQHASRPDHQLVVDASVFGSASMSLSLSLSMSMSMSMSMSLARYRRRVKAAQESVATSSPMPIPHLAASVRSPLVRPPDDRQAPPVLV